MARTSEVDIRRAEETINSLIDKIHHAGGKIWIQSVDNRDHYYALDSHVGINFFLPVERS